MGVRPEAGRGHTRLPLQEDGGCLARGPGAHGHAGSLWREREHQSGAADCTPTGPVPVSLAVRGCDLLHTQGGGWGRPAASQAPLPLPAFDPRELPTFAGPPGPSWMKVFLIGQRAV